MTSKRMNHDPGSQMYYRMKASWRVVTDWRFRYHHPFALVSAYAWSAWPRRRRAFRRRCNVFQRSHLRIPCAFVALSGVLLVTGLKAQQPADSDEGMEVLARGPLHEAFAAPVVFDPEPGLVVPEAPPESIEELPPDERPDGNSVMWIDGYWSWDDETNSFIWVSGIWRDVPPDRDWVPGYWLRTATGAQWISGYWRAGEKEIVEYLPSPPASIEVGPSSEPPSSTHMWAPGCWVWRDSRYLWRPGYWVVSEADWVWAPAQYVWTPRGCIFVDGYWDYAPVRRGVVFAPVRISSVVYSRPAYVYRPRFAIDVNVAIDHFFARPRIRHYYYGDYYAHTYIDAGIYPSFSFHYSRYGYDPIYARQLVIHRRTNPRWEVSVRAEFTRRREHVELRPARVYSRQHGTVSIARPFAEYRQVRSAEVRFARTSPEQFSRAKSTSSEIRDRRRVRASNEAPAARSANAARGENQVRRMELPRSRTQTDGSRQPDVTRRAPVRPNPPAPDSQRRAAPETRRPTPTERIKRSDGPGRRPTRKAPEKKRP